MDDGSQRRFTALATFEAPETSSTYVEGLSYVARTKWLDAVLDLWLAAGKVKIESGNVAMARGIGVVT